MMTFPSAGAGEDGIPPVFGHPDYHPEGRYVGVITEGDLLWHVKNQDFMNLRMAEEEPLSEVHRRTNAQAVGVRHQH